MTGRLAAVRRGDRIPKMRPYLFDVLLPMIHPVRAVPGDVIAVRPGHPHHPVAVVRWSGGAWTLVRVGPPNYGALLIPLLDGVLAERTPGARRVLAA
jgi:hypothetical protein